MINVRSAIVLIPLSIFIAGCSARMDHEGYYRVEPIDDATILPYKFTISKKKIGLGNARNLILQQYVPVNIYDNGATGMYLIDNNWRPADSLTAILFYADTEEKKVLSQININTTHVTSHFPYDFDCDNVTEVAVMYTIRDTLWLDIIDPHQRRISRQSLVVGQDRDGNGFWDGSGAFCGMYDFNGDGYVELLVNCDVDYDLYPRKLMCVDWFNNEIVWEYGLAGIVNYTQTYVEPLAPEERLSIVFGVCSKGNAARTEDMDDQHSYLIVLDENGKLRWKKETGGVFSSCVPVLIDYDNDGNTDILTTGRYKATGTAESAAMEYGGMFKIYNTYGSGLDSIDYGVGRIISSVRSLDFDSDGTKELFVSLSDASIIIYNQSLSPIQKARFYTTAIVWDCRDFLGKGNNQLLVTTEDNKLWLLDKSFKPLAQFGEGESLCCNNSAIYKERGSQKGYNLVVVGNSGQVNYFLTFVKSPWNTVFFRYPLLAFLAAFLPMSLVVALIWFNWYRTRKQNKVMSQQRDRLNTALEDLKAAQEKLIAVEEYQKTWDALLTSENRYKTLVENLPQRIFLKDKDSIYVSCNQHYARDLRIKPDEIAGKTDYDFHPKELAEKYRVDDKRIVESGKIEDIEERYIQDGRDVWVHTVKTPIKDEKGNIVGVLGIFRDITERKQAEEALREKEERYALATSAAKVGVWDWDMRSGSFYLDPNVKALLGYEDSEIPNDIEVWTQYIHPDDKDAVMQAASDHLEGRTPAYVFEHRMLHKDGTIRWFMVRGTAVRDAGGNAVRMVGTDTDITERKRAEEALRESEEEYRDLTEKMVDVIYTLDTEGTVTSVNEAIKATLGFEPKEVIGKSFTELVPQEEVPEAMAAFQQILSGERLTRETVLVDKNGTPHNVEFSSSPIIKDNQAVGTRGIVRDITERKRVDAREKARLQLLNDLRTAKNVDACLKRGCEAIHEARLFRRAVLTLHNNKKEITNLGQVGLDESVVQAARNATAPDDELSKKITQEKYRISHSYFIPEEAGLGMDELSRYISQTDYVERGDLSWKAGDELFVPIIGDDNRYEGWLSVDTPFNGERPTIEIVRFLEQVVDIVTQKVREIRTLEKLRQGHRALLESEERFRNVSASAQDAILMMDNEGRVSFWNEAAERVFGYQAEEILGKPLHETLGAERFHDAYRKGFGQFRDVGEGAVIGQTLELAAVRKDGTEFPIELSVSAVKLKGKWNAVGILRDITERKEAEEELRLLSHSVNSSVDGIAMGDLEMRVTYVNDAFTEMFGYSKEELIGKEIASLYAEDQIPKLEEALKATIEGGWAGELIGKRKDGQLFPIAISASRVVDDKGKIIAHMACHRDITERKRAEQELRSERDFVHSLLDTANSLIVCLDNRARITVFNNECEKVTGYTREEIIGKSWPDIFLPEDHFHHRIKNFAEWVRQHPQDMYEGPLKTKSGQIRTILWSNSALFSSDSNELTAIAVGQDITERKEAERQLQIANQERYNQIKQIAGGVAHEIHNALFPAATSLAKLKQRLGITSANELDRNRILVELTEKAVARAVRTTELVTSYSKLELEKRREQVNLASLFQTIIKDNKLRIEELGVTVTLDIPDDFCCNCYHIHAYSLFNNLMLNALDALAEVEQRRISISAFKEGDRVKTEFSDSGPGIPSENIEKVFSAFFSTKPRTGTGLGLAMAKRIVELNNGSIQVNSLLDKGAKFTILLPSY